MSVVPIESQTKSAAGRHPAAQLNATEKNQLRQRLREYKDAEGWNEDQLGHQVTQVVGTRISGASLGNFIRNKVDGDDSNIASLVAQYFVAIDTKRMPAQTFVETDVTRQILSVFYQAELTSLIACASTGPGAGKSTAIAMYMQERARDAVFVTMSGQIKSAWPLLSATFYKASGSDGRHKTSAENIQRVLVENLAKNRRPVIFDEAQHLDDEQLDLLRTVVVDEAKCPLFLVGNYRVFERSTPDSSQMSAHTQFTGRVIARVHYDNAKIRKNDVRAVALKLARKTLVDETIDVLTSAAKSLNGFRTVTSVLVKARIAAGDREPSRKDVVTAAHRLLKGETANVIVDEEKP